MGFIPGMQCCIDNWKPAHVTHHSDRTKEENHLAISTENHLTSLKTPFECKKQIINGKFPT